MTGLEDARACRRNSTITINIISHILSEHCRTPNPFRYSVLHTKYNHDTQAPLSTSPPRILPSPSHIYLPTYTPIYLLIIPQFNLQDILPAPHLQQLQYRTQILIRHDRVLGPCFSVAAGLGPVDFELLDRFFCFGGFFVLVHDFSRG